jgi:hypothetical protein
VSGINFQACSFNHAPAPSGKNATWAQRAPSARAGIPGYFHQCAQTFSAAGAKSAMFSGDFETCGGLKNRRLARRKSAIRQVLISRTLRTRGEVAERLKAAVC